MRARVRVRVYHCFRDLASIISNDSLLEMELCLGICIDSLLLHNRLLQNLELKTTNIYYHTVSEGQESRSSLTGSDTGSPIRLGSSRRLGL